MCSDQEDDRAKSPMEVRVLPVPADSTLSHEHLIKFGSRQGHVVGEDDLVESHPGQAGCIGYGLIDLLDGFAGKAKDEIGRRSHSQFGRVSNHIRDFGEVLLFPNDLIQDPG